MSRTMAMAIDIGVLAVITLVTADAAGLLQRFLPTAPGLQTAIAYGIAAGLILLPAAYETLGLAVFGRTIGKAVVGLRVVRLDGRRPGVGRSFLRYLAYFASALPLYLGFLWVLVDAERRGWHDHIVRTRVVYDGRRPSAAPPAAWTTPNDRVS